MKAIITSANKSILQEDGSEFIDVAFDVVDEEGTVADSKHLAFPLDTSADDIQKDVAKYVSTYEADLTSKEANKERNAMLAQADATIEEIVGKEISTPAPADVAETPEN